MEENNNASNNEGSFELIEKIVSLMSKNSLNEFYLKEGDLEINLKRKLGTIATPVVSTNEGVQAQLQEIVPEVEPAVSEEKYQEVTSPMVGTFYKASSPENPAFVKVGDEVNEDTVVCIIEAMKVMNEIKAGCFGIIKDVFPKDGTSVQFGEVLFRVV